MIKELAIAVGILALVVTGTADAGPCSAIAGGWSHHFDYVQDTDRDKDWNETHRAFGIECYDLSAIRFDNSYGKEAYGIGYTYNITKRDLYDVGLYGAMWTGYEELYGEPGVIPVLSPRVDVHLTDNLTILTFINPVVPVVAFRWRF